MPSFLQTLALKKQAYGLAGAFKTTTPESLGRDLLHHLVLLKKEIDGTPGIFSSLFGNVRDPKMIVRQKKICLALIDLGADLRTADSVTSVAQQAYVVRDDDILHRVMQDKTALEMPVTGKKDTLLTGFCENFHFDRALRAVEAGANVDAENQDGNTALCILARFNAYGETHMRLAQAILDRNADINHVNKEGLTPAFIAGEHFNEAVFALLARAGADLSVPCKDKMDIVTRLKKRNCPGGDKCLEALNREKKALDEKRQALFNTAAQGFPAAANTDTPDIDVKKKKTKLRIVDLGL